MAPEPVSPAQTLLGLPREALPDLRDRLFDLSRRNRMLYFRPTRGSLGLPSTQGLISRAGIRLDALDVVKKLASQARRDTAEYGVSSLHVIPSFLLRPDEDEPGETVRSPLLLIPVSLTRDGTAFRLRATVNEAVVNPVLRFDLERRYGLDLPEMVSVKHFQSMVDAFRDDSWTVDTGSVTLTTIAYRSSALIRDYRSLIDQRPSITMTSDERKSSGEHLVLPADDSQREVIRAAAAGESFVVQGPPGTGKSQTIANLIADAVANGRTVLFVCTKRAALDVVHARLRECGIADLSCLIHDARADRPAFVHGLRDSYHAWKESPDDAAELQVRVERTTENLAAAEQLLEKYAEMMDAPCAPEGPSLRWVLGRLIEMTVTGPAPDHAPAGELPDLADWWPARRALAELDARLEGVRLDRVPARFMPPPVLEALLSGTPEYAGSRDPDVIARHWAKVALNLVNSRRESAAKLAEATERAQGWQTDLPVDDLRRSQHFWAAEKLEGRIARFFSSDWRAARNLVRREYHGPLASVAQALKLLQDEKEALSELRACESALRIHMGRADEADEWPGTVTIQALNYVLENGAPAAGLTRALLDLHAHPALLPWLRSGQAAVAETEEWLLRYTLSRFTPTLTRFETDELLLNSSIIAESRPQMDRLTARLVKALARKAFRDQDSWSRLPAHQLPGAQRQERDEWASGRQILLREFRKVRAHRPIRELASGSTGKLVERLRPVWLMSPEAVSDTLPLTAGRFDLVIVDEASQMPVETAVPAIHRGRQLIVVGDRMQLPPTRFFEAGETAETAESLLARASRTLPTRMLTWHYRSRSEDLVAFNNAHFYDGRLRMAPRPRELTMRHPPLVAETGVVPLVQVKEGVDALLDRSVSLHSTPGARYRQQANRGEARYVAELVRELLRRRTGLTIGVVAFSLAQRAALDKALDELEAVDEEFAELFAAEQDRLDREQAVGLFVKNLENVQGDERDVMILSVGYGPDAQGRIPAAFGPLSTEGGERRLNVVTSRARSHLAVVTTLPIGPAGIRPGPNPGTEMLRRFLAYASAVSTGDLDRAHEQLAEVRTPEASPPASLIKSRLTHTLRARGLEVTDGFAAGMFRIDLAVSSPQQPGTWVAVLFEATPEPATRAAALEPLRAQPVLGRAGWKVVPVLLKDWYLTPDEVLMKITAWFRGQ